MPRRGAKYRVMKLVRGKKQAGNEAERQAAAEYEAKENAEKEQRLEAAGAT
jgi:hypothetical protein